MKFRRVLLWSAIVFGLLSVAFVLLSPRHRGDPLSGFLAAPLWQRMAAPGELSKSHAFLENNCAACHTPYKGVQLQNCVVCHADNTTVLQRQPSAFHADIAECAPCHLEHQGRIPRVTNMDHVALARIGLRQLQKSSGGQDRQRNALVSWLNQANPSPMAPQLERHEALLNCATCHQTKDRHVGLFGTDCASCHDTTKWTVPAFRHPSPVSESCAQCHQAPPSHYMMHFKMVSMHIAHMEKAEVNQCFLCHQTTSWNDIKGVGYYKHH